MKNLNVPHYRQTEESDCQAACAAMVLDFCTDRDDGGDVKRIDELFQKFAFGFKRENGGACPAITGLVAMVIAKKGLAVDFYSENRDGGGIDGLKFLRREPYKWSNQEIAHYAKHAKGIMARAPQSGVAVHEYRISSQDIEAAIASEKPVVAIVDVLVLKGHPKSANHAVVITGIDETSVSIQDPAVTKPHQKYDREHFFNAHWRKETDCDAYMVTQQHGFRKNES